MAGENNPVATDTEGSSYIGLGSDRGTFGESDRNVSARPENNEFRPDDSANRRSL
jgi:hypothetical protein